MNTIIYLLMGAGGFWVIACLIFAGIKLSAAQSKPEARSQAFVGLAMAFVGGLVIVKAYDIAGWITGLGG
nr:hypothetical protein [Bacillus sp. SM2101]